ncbi:hypothetical protein DFH28DRAFT_1159482 [Melampsora americana]|nr:hypothetical protein DFH28DRAFT_1159482 [Melampsora americana]
MSQAMQQVDSQERPVTPVPASGDKRLSQVIGQIRQPKNSESKGETGDVSMASDHESEGATDEENESDSNAEIEIASGQDKSGAIPQAYIDRLSKIKIPKMKRAPSEELSSSQAVRKMKVASALARFQRFKAIHEESLKAFKDFQDSTKDEDDPIDFDGEIDLMMTALSLSDQALKKREERLNVAITEGQDEIEIIPFHNPIPQASNPHLKRPAGTSSKKSRGASVKRYLDLEAGVSEKEVQEEGCGGKKKRRKVEYKSEEFVYDDGDSCGDSNGSSQSEEESEEEEIRGPDAIQGEVVNAKDANGKGKEVANAKATSAKAPPPEDLPISPSSIFHNSDSILDVSKLIQNPTSDEVRFLRDGAATLATTQFDWGEALKESVIGVISSWRYHENSQLGQPTHEKLQPLVVLLKRKVNEKDTPKVIQACPRLLQVAATDPYLTESSINWQLIQDSTRYPWDSRHRIFRAFHSMACRTSKATVWTTEKDIKNKLRTAHKTIHRIFEESVELISYNAKSENIEIKTQGEHKVAASMVPMSQSIAWAWQQCMMKAMEEQEVKSSKVHPLGIGWLQKRFLLVLTGVMLIYERDVYNRQLKMYCKVKRTPTQITARRNELKGSVLHQLSSDYIRKNPVKAIAGLKKNQVPSSDALAKVTEKEIQSAANDETFNFRRQAIQALALFLMFGTSGLFHVWVWYREQKMTDAALMIHMSSILAQRRTQASTSEPHVFYQRSWSRLDHHLFTILREFIDDKGDFKRKIQWPELTRMFHDRFSPTSLAYLYTLDLCLELHAPLSSRGPDGSVAPDFDSNSKNQGQALIPITEPFRSVWATTEGKAVPVTDPQAMYKEADGSRVTKKHPLKTIAQAKEKAREEIVDGGNEEGSLAEDE